MAQWLRLFASFTEDLFSQQPCRMAHNFVIPPSEDLSLCTSTYMQALLLHTHN